MTRQNKGANRFRTPTFQRFSQRQRVAEALAHLHAVQRQRPDQHPVIGKCRAVMGALALCNFALVVREDIVNAAAVNVECFAQVFPRHCRTFNVPAGESFAHGLFQRMMCSGSAFSHKAKSAQ